MSVRAVYDCMLFFAHAARPQRVRETFQFVADKSVTVCMSADVLAEVRDVLSREELRAKFPALTPEAVAAYLSDLLAHSELITSVPRVYTVERDPKDSKYIDLAVAARAPFLVTRDLDLLDLMAEQNPAGRDFRRRFPDLQILEPRDFVRVVDKLK
jgi:putative PIN family toxin of toxin-antitoxin system